MRFFRLGSNGTTVVFSNSVCLAFVNASSCSSDQRKAVPFFISGLIFAVRSARPGMFFCVRNFDMASYLLLSGEILFLEIMCPAN